MPAIEVILPGNISDSFHYSVPKRLRRNAQIGKRVMVPLGNRRSIGFIIGVSAPPDGVTLRDIMDVIDEEPLFDEKRLKFFKWTAGYYVCPLGAVIKAAHPSGLGSMRVKRKVVLTAEGEAALGKGLAGADGGVLRALAPGPMTLEKLFEVVEGGGFARVYGLEQKGLVDIEYEVRRANIRYETVYSAPAGSSGRSEISTMPAKQAVVRFIEERTDAPRSEIRELLGNSVTAHLKWLEEKGLIQAEKRETVRDPFADIKPDDRPAPRTTTDQKKAFSEIKKSLNDGEFSPFLLHGVTGSGKTEVYMRAIEEAKKKKRQSLVMVPEISLTPQLVSRFKGRFGSEVTVMHSMLSEGERFDAWRRVRDGRVRIVIGARSAIFAPFSNLGLIVVDEEHERSYKQEDKQPCYNARDLALVLGRMEKIPVILGSATPSVESYHNAKEGRFRYISMPLRVEGGMLPVVEVVKQEKTVFSAPLKKALIENHNKGGKAIVFLNRRGFSTTLVCGACDTVVSCPNCSISLTYHKRDGAVKCHYCGVEERFENSCRACGGELIRMGTGTQAVEDEIKGFLAGATVERMDRDASGTKTNLLDLYGKLERGAIDVLVGTQMVAKGHDLPGVTLVGVVSADMSLAIPDFRGGEITFQTLTQVAGRAGRRGAGGKAVIQTLNPDHPSIKYAVSQDAVAFLEGELKARKNSGWPPFSRVAALRLSGPDENAVRLAARRIHSLAVRSTARMKRRVEVVGHSECPVYRIKNRFRWHIIMRSESAAGMGALIAALKEEAEKTMPPKTRFSADIDPVSFL